ncbi:hypothetical protein DSM106972_096580 [Dulcicalothrix desertica PCC 7102]|uniref:Uncharacterized protein n=1 Tax=Dulcicalothrix desertica PCC 7102 TaxID=232991 RepID=A0A3S1BQS9_9CYAN|nr:hypothetical protein [Dulcicalothrix desertica]RUS93302.1 hypothetical protein DSM106972_096580 [Dulcicalothrix desertica PCC 7102]TWH62760.1 hypothetical protein CAL7102_00283 [Dulcicalothrix desertica PCC 7102]
MSIKHLTVGLTISLIVGLFPNSPTIAQETIVDSQCRNHQQIHPDDGYRIFYKSEFKVGGENYWLYSARYEDGAAIVCISKPGFKQARHLKLKPIDSVFIHEVTNDARNKAAFLVTVAGGNGSYVPMTQYRLSLSTPNKPVLTKLRTWTSRD